MATFDGVSVKNTANAVITDAAISGSTNFWRGAYINFAAGYFDISFIHLIYTYKEMIINRKTL